jgi:hypothetical protein
MPQKKSLHEPVGLELKKAEARLVVDIMIAGHGLAKPKELDAELWDLRDKIYLGLSNVETIERIHALYLELQRETDKNGGKETKKKDNIPRIRKAVRKQMIQHFNAACEEVGPPDTPFALAIIGQPGAGFFKAASQLYNEYFIGGRVGGGKRPAVIYGEDFGYFHDLAPGLLKKYDPVQMTEVSHAAWKLERNIIKYLTGSKRNIIWQGKCLEMYAVPTILEMIMGGGYRVEVVFLAVPGRVSAARALMEYEWLKQTRGLAFPPNTVHHTDVIRYQAHVGHIIEDYCKAHRIRVINDEGQELHASDIPCPILANGKKARAWDALQNEHSRGLTLDERRTYINMLGTVAQSMDYRNAPEHERRKSAKFIYEQFSESPGVVQFARERIAAGKRATEASPVRAEQTPQCEMADEEWEQIEVSEGTI